jgi:iron complex transport system ATP-binding protein
MSDPLACAALVCGQPEKPLHQPLTWALPAGHICCLLGRNGAGKTTLLRTLLGLLPPIAGGYSCSGRDPTLFSAEQRAASIAYVPQRAIVPPAMSVAQLLSYGAYARLTGSVNSTLAQLGLTAFADRVVAQLSGGEQQRVMIARAVHQAARVLVLDEPTAHLDLAQQAATLQTLADVAARGTSVLFSSHHPDEAARIADSVMLLMPDGEIIAGTVSDEAVLSPTLLSRVYGIPVQASGAGRARQFSAVISI